MPGKATRGEEETQGGEGETTYELATDLIQIKLNSIWIFRGRDKIKPDNSFRYIVKVLEGATKP